MKAALAKQFKNNGLNYVSADLKRPHNEFLATKEELRQLQSGRLSEDRFVNSGYNFRRERFRKTAVAELNRR